MSRHVALATAAAAAALALSACAQPGTQAPTPQAAKLAVGTSDISTACGYREELTATNHPSARELAPIESMAQTGAEKLAFVYARDQTDIYQGDSIGALLEDSISLLHDCGLTGAENTLRHELRAHR